MEQDFISWGKKKEKAGRMVAFTHMKKFNFLGEVLVSYEHTRWCSLEVFRVMKAFNYFRVDANCSSQEAF